MKKLYPMFFLLGCSRPETPELPDLNRESFSTETVLHRQEELKEKIKGIDHGKREKSDP